MKQRFAAAILALVVLGLVAFGGWKWSTRREVERTVNIFLTAMIQGEAETLQSYMDGPALDAYLAKTPEDQAAFAAPIPDAQAEIREVHLQRKAARVRVLWKVAGFDVWSDLQLEKSEGDGWKIVDIHQPNMIPTWDQVRKKISRDNARSPVEQALGEKFEDRDGVEVRSIAPGELDR